MVQGDNTTLRNEEGQIHHTKYNRGKIHIFLSSNLAVNFLHQLAPYLGDQ